MDPPSLPRVHRSPPFTPRSRTFFTRARSAREPSLHPYAFRKPPRTSAHFKGSLRVDQRAGVQIDNAIHSYSVTVSTLPFCNADTPADTPCARRRVWNLISNFSFFPLRVAVSSSNLDISLGTCLFKFSTIAAGF